MALKPLVGTEWSGLWNPNTNKLPKLRRLPAGSLLFYSYFLNNYFLSSPNKLLSRLSAIFIMYLILWTTLSSSTTLSYIADA